MTEFAKGIIGSTNGYAGTDMEITWFIQRMLSEQIKPFKCEVDKERGNILKITDNDTYSETEMFIVCRHFDRMVLVDDIIEIEEELSESFIGIITDSYYSEQAKYYAQQNNILLLNEYEINGMKKSSDFVVNTITEYLDKNRVS